MEPFADAYLAGRTPIPCVACNQRFKFHHLLERARALGAARRRDRALRARRRAIPRRGRRRLLRGRRRGKDQTYFLFDLDQAQLARARFPLGELAKDEVRARARALGLATAEKPESQEICFVPDGDYAARRRGAAARGAAPGDRRRSSTRPGACSAATPASITSPSGSGAASASRSASAST